MLDDVPARARARDDVDVAAVEFTSPPGDRPVTLPPVPGSGHVAPRVPLPGNLGNGS